MATPSVAPGRTVWSTAARGGAWVLLIAALTALGFLVYLWPWLLVCIAAGAALGSLPLLFRRFGALRASLPVAFGLFVIVVIGSLLGGGAQHAVEPGLRPGVQPATYAADLQYVATGYWSGLEQFDLTREQAIAFAGRGRGLKRRLAEAVPEGWTVKPLGMSSYRLEHPVKSQPFTVPKGKPLTTSAHFHVPDLPATEPRFSVFAGKGSTVTLHAPATRIRATTPTSSPKPEATSESVRTVSLTGRQQRPTVTVEVKSDLAAQLPDSWLAPTFVGVVAAVFSTLGLTFVAAGSHVVRAARWLLGRAHKPTPPPTRTQQVLSGREDKAAALRAYLTERGVATDRAESELALAAHDAKKLAGEALAVAGARGASSRYARELSKPSSSGTAELDAVYAALRAAGLPDAELRWLDVRLDEAIIARHEPAAR